jgi:hypothetical protein
MLATYAATFLVYWVVLASWLPGSRLGAIADMFGRGMR